MSVHEALARGRAVQEQRFTEQVTVGRIVETVDEDTLQTSRTIADPPRYSGRAQIAYPSSTSSTVEVAGQIAAVAAPVAKLPLDAPRLKKGDTVLVDSSTVDPSLVGREFTVGAPPQSGQVTSHRYRLEEVG